MKFREFILKSGTKIFLGKDAKNNDKLVKKFRGKGNVIIHTVASGSPFCVIENLNPTKEEIKEAGIICASKSQDWRDNKSNIKIDIFTGKDVKKTIFMKTGSWRLRNKPKALNIDKKDIKSWEREHKKR